MTHKTCPEADQQAELRCLINDHVGKRIRLQRTNLGLSAAALGQFLNVRYQQIHFYERGDNQVTSSALYRLSQALDVPISFFFDGIPQLESEKAAPSQADLEDTVNIFNIKDIKEIEQEIRNLSEIFYMVSDKITRKGIIDFLKILGRQY